MSGDSLTQGRAAFGQRAWSDAYRQLSASDSRRPLDADDLDLVATAAYLTGRHEAATDAWARAHGAYIDRGAADRAARCAFWLGLTSMLRGEHALAGGWMGRAQAALEATNIDCVENGYLRVPSAMGDLHAGRPAEAHAAFEEIAAIADHFGDPDLRALCRLGRGQALIATGDAARGIGMLDDAMLAVTIGEVSPVPAGIIYCAVILACKDVFDVRRAQEWTEALSRWCDAQQDLKPYQGQCLVHRSELMELRGRWADALAEVHDACAHLSDPPGDPVLGMALYQRGELLRLRGDDVGAEESYRRAGDYGHSMHPGLALLRLAQGRHDDALGAIRRTVAEAEGPTQRSRVLAAYVEIAVAAGENDEARSVSDELEQLVTQFDSLYLQAMAGFARGSVLLVHGDAAAAVAVLRRSWFAWQELEAPYEAARVRLQMAVASRHLGDHDTAAVEFDAARRVFERLQAAPSLAQARSAFPALAALAQGQRAGDLTAREVEVLRLVATGATNREIAESLVISDKTVARHVANMFTKLGLSSRSAATAYAYQNEIV